MPSTSALPAQLGAILRSRGQWLGTAESCTGGLIAKLLTDVAGSSAWFDRGLVTYSNEAKMDLLGVPSSILETHGAVSGACARAMVAGLLQKAPLDWGIAVTGIAGPGGGSDEKPVGTVWIAWQRRLSTADAERFLFPGDRSEVRAATATAALEGLLARLK